MAVTHPEEHVRAEAERGSGWYAALARTGLVAKGVSFAIVGVLALKLALGDGGKATSRQGALHSLAGSSIGKVLLVAHLVTEADGVHVEVEPGRLEALADDVGCHLEHLGGVQLAVGVTPPLVGTSCKFVGRWG
jgi:hypothetical protein